MSRFSQAYQLGFSVLADNNGREIGYVKTNADDVTIVAIVGPEQIVEAEEEQGAKRYSTRTLRIARTLLTALDWADKFRIDGELYSLREVNNSSETAYTLTVMRAVSRTVGRPRLTQTLDR